MFSSRIFDLERGFPATLSKMQARTLLLWISHYWSYKTSIKEVYFTVLLNDKLYLIIIIIIIIVFLKLFLIEYVYIWKCNIFCKG